MRFFSGTRDAKKGNKMSASELFKQKQNAKVGAPVSKDEEYKRMIEARMEKRIEDVMTGKKMGGFKLPGTKADDTKPKEMSKNAKQMLEALKEQKRQKDAKKQKKKDAEWDRTQKASNKAEAYAADATANIAQTTETQSSYFFGNNDNN